jgi:hypothetical protein
MQRSRYLHFRLLDIGLRRDIVILGIKVQTVEPSFSPTTTPLTLLRPSKRLLTRSMIWGSDPPSGGEQNMHRDGDRCAAETVST